MSVAQAQREIDVREFVEWMEYDKIDPIGDDRADLRAGIVAATVANAAGGRKGRPMRPGDFMPQYDRPAQTPAQGEAIFRAWAMAHNAQRRKG